MPETRELSVSAAIAAFTLLGRPPPDAGGRRRAPESSSTLEATGTSGLGPWVWPPAAVGYLSRCGLADTEPAVVRHARHSRYEALRSRLRSLDGLTIRSPEAPVGAVPHGVVVTLDDGGHATEAAATALRERGLPVERFQWPLTVESAALDAYPGARALREELLVLPCHQQVPLRAIEPMVETLRAAVEDRRSIPANPPSSR